MKQDVYRITGNEPIAPGVYRMTLSGDTGAISTPGQFINIRLEGFYARRPISVCDWNDSTITIIYKRVGDGTEKMSRLPSGTALDILTGLGNGFNTAKSGEAPLLIGGGVGCAPLYCLCKRLLEEGKRPSVILGFNTAEEVLLREEFAGLGVPVTVTTADGSCGVRGFVSDAMPAGGYTYFYTCGPAAMFRAVNKRAVTSGQFSYEARMGCGFGACMACSCKTRFGAKRICKDGPVFEREEIIWAD